MSLTTIPWHYWSCRFFIGYHMVLLGIVFASQCFIFPYRLAIGNGSSMSPSYNSGDISMAEKHFTDLKKGDVIAFQVGRDGMFIEHRIIRVLNETFLTKGDNNEYDDQALFERYFGTAYLPLERVKS
jgi:signal peptidase I